MTMEMVTTATGGMVRAVMVIITEMGTAVINLLGVPIGSFI